MKINLAVLYQMPTAFGIAVLGIVLIHFTVRPDPGITPKAVDMNTMAAADRAGAMDSPTNAPSRMTTWTFK